MHEVQWFELEVRGVSALVEPDGERTLEDAITFLFRRPLGKLATRIPGDEALQEDLQSAVETRNTLAHEFLVLSQIRLRAGIVSMEQLLELVQEVRIRFEDVRRRLDDFRQTFETELGVDAGGGLTDDEVTRLIREVDGL